MSALNGKWYTQEEWKSANAKLYAELQQRTPGGELSAKELFGPTIKAFSEIMLEQRILLNRAAEILKDREDGCFCDANDCAACLKSQSLLTQIKGAE